MNISIIGASAGVGLETVKRALARGHVVTTLARSDVPVAEHTSLRRVKGSALVKADVVAALQSADALIVALGTGKSRAATTMYSDFAKLLLNIHAESPIEIPVIILTGFGAGQSLEFFPNVLFKKAFQWFLGDVYRDKTLMEQMLTQSTLRWMMVRPGVLFNGDLTERYRVQTELVKGMRVGSIKRADVADFMVKQAESPTCLLAYPALSNR